MQRLQPRLALLEKDYREFALKVEMQMANRGPAGTNALIVSLRVQLAPMQDPLVLFDRRADPGRGCVFRP